MPVLWSVTPLSPLYVSPDLKTVHTRTLPGCAIHASKTWNQIIPNLHLCVHYRMYCIILSSFSDVWGSRGNPEKATKTCWRRCRPSCRILIVLAIVFPAQPWSCNHTAMTWENMRYGYKDGDVSVAQNRKTIAKEEEVIIAHLASSNTS